ncbi:MAG TPA: YCF48-related protein [Puia sp.]
MKRLLFFSMTVCLYLSCSKSNSNSNPGTPSTTEVDTLNNWVKQSYAGIELEDIWFTDIKTGFIAGSTSIYTTTDSGNTWAAVPNTSNFKVYNIQFLDNLHGFVQGSTQLGITIDGGNTWSSKTIASGYAYTFQFVTPATGYYNDYNKGIYKTTDTGTTWNLIYDGTGKGPNFFFDFLDSSNGFAMVNAHINKTTDGGNNWQLVASNITDTSFKTFYKMQFLDTLHGYFGSPNGLFKTSDGGKSWSNVLPRQTTFMLPHFFDINNGYCVAANTIYKTTDGGTNWIVSCKLGQDDFSGIHFLDINTGWATTFGGFVLRLKS